MLKGNIRQINIYKVNNPSFYISPDEVMNNNKLVEEVYIWIKENESLSDLLSYSGGLSENAFKKSIKLTRIIDDKYKVVDVNSDQFDFFQPKPGDKYVVDQVIDKYNNRVIIKGVPALWSPNSNGGKPISVTLKSGNFGQSDFFSRALIALTNK